MTITRRRAIFIAAAAAGLPLLRAGGALASSREAISWSGTALGAPATLLLNHEDRAQGERIVERVVAEVSRLEAIFSIYRADSAISALNRDGFLAAPPAELTTLLDSCRTFWAATGGGFDPTIQPLWALYAGHFSSPSADPAGPSEASKKAVLALVGFDALRFNKDRIVFEKPGMALTLNGVAQGFITDRIVDLLREAGVTSSMVDMGEDYALGARADGSPWRVGLAMSQDDSTPDQVVNLVNKAVATSSQNGLQFDAAGRFGHILDPRSGKADRIYKRVSVVADDATTADAFSTAISLLKPDAAASLVKANPAIKADLLTDEGHSRFGDWS